MADLDAGESDDPRLEADRLVADLADAHEDLERARDRVDAVGEAALRDLADAYDELTDLFDRYEEEVTGDGDFQTFIEFQGTVETFTEDLDDVRHHDVFEAVDDLLQQRRLTESDWAEVRDRLQPVREDLARLEEREDALRAYRDARAAVKRRRSDLADRIDDLEQLQRLGDADLEAPTERLRDPIETYNERVRESFRTFRSSASAREVMAFLEATAAYPLVDYRRPPDDIVEFVRTHEAGTEPVTTLVEYADYSRSKLDHYVDDPDALKRTVGTQQTYLRRLDAEPLTVDWPPPDAETLRFLVRELTGVVDRFADAETMQALRAVRALPRETDYERLRESAQARDQLGPEERDRLASGAVAEELEACRDAKSRLEEGLEQFPEE